VVLKSRDAGVSKLVCAVGHQRRRRLLAQPSRFRGDRNREVEQLAVGSGLAW